ncbi:MAG: LPS assembly lipoprotein LptE, partial [Saprospiraceae bacterium]
ALNRLEIRIRVAYVGNLDEKYGWAAERDFSHFAEFSNDVDLLTVQDALIRQIGDQLLEDIFNAAFNNW